MYGIIISLGILASLLTAERLAKKRGMNLDLFWGSSLWLIIGGVAGARIYYVIEHWDVFSQHPITALFIHRGGLGIFGAVLGGALSLLIYFRTKKRHFLDFLDLSAVVIPLGQAIGRWGNFVNKELFGPPTDLPWGMFVPPQHRPAMYRYNDVFHPLFLYESLLDILLFFALLLLYQRKTMLDKSKSKSKPIYALKGFFTLAYLIGYGIIRFSTEFIRLQTWVINGVNITQLISASLVAAGVIGLFLLAKKPKKLIIIASINGFLISSYLVFKNFADAPLLCGASRGCDVVQQSKYSTLLGIPVSLWGLLYYTLLFGIFYYNKGKYLKLTRTIWVLWGFLFSSFLTALEIFVIHAYCIWCLASFINIILISTLYLFYKERFN